MTALQKVRVVLATVGVLLACSASNATAVAGVISAHNGTIISSGHRTGLQQVFAWYNQCGAVPNFVSGHAMAGDWSGFVVFSEC